MNAATATEWLTAAAIGTSAFIPGALLILSLDHNLTPRMPHVPLEPALIATEQAIHRARLQVAGLLLILALREAR